MKPNVVEGKQFNGRWYNPDGKGYYYNSHTRKRLHQAVWIYHNGPIPKGYEIHHKDFNKENNDISNLTCITAAEHRKIHADSLTGEQRQWFRNNLDKNARPKASEWHKSEVGREWHREHAKKMAENGTSGFVKRVPLKCSYCGKDYEGVVKKNQPNHFCSNNCKAKFLRRKRAQDKSERRICVLCGKEFMASPWSGTKTCSSSCACKLRAANMKAAENIPVNTKSLFQIGPRCVIMR